MQPWIRLARRSNERCDRLRAKLSSFGLDNVFNPSQLEFGGRSWCAFRAFGPSGRAPLHAYLLAPSRSGDETQLVSLTEHCGSFGVPVVADPKLFLWRGELWATFNSGFVAKEPNEIFLLRLTPELGRPLECRLDERQRIEKNWAFFEDAGQLHAVYGLAPVRTLVVDEWNEENGVVHLRTETTGPDSDPRLGELTIGTPVRARGSDLFLIAHEKIRLRRKRGYVGHPVRLIRDGSAFRAETTPLTLIHSFWGLLGPRIRLNPHLLFCTYFSGLDFQGDRVRLGYGINDNTLGFAELELSELWPSAPTTGTAAK